MSKSRREKLRPTRSPVGMLIAEVEDGNKTSKCKFSPKTAKQKEYYEAIMDNIATVGLGSPGTGKTFLACAAAIKLLENKDIDKIIVTKPLVEVGSKLGALPGGVEEKIEPFIRSVKDNFLHLVGAKFLAEMETRKCLEIIPLEHLRGLTFDNALVIADEMQNASHMQIKTLLTRVGENTKIILTSDMSQCDIGKDRSGFPAAISILGRLDNVSLVSFGTEDIVRSGFAKAITIAYEEYESCQKPLAQKSSGQ